MAGTYSEVAQNDEDDHDHDHDHADIHSPFESLSPALSSSPMPFLPSVKSSFTPLSMEDSDILPAIDRGGTDTDYQGAEADLDNEKGIVSTATTTENNHNKFTARATRALGKSSHHEYEPLAPNSACSPGSPSFSTDPKLPEKNTSVGLDSAVLREREPGLKPRSPIASSGYRGGQSQARNLSSGIASPKHIPNSPTSRIDGDSQQPIVVKPKPLIRTASTKSVSLRHPTPEPNPRTPSYASNIAQLEATAERLSLTSSIEDAIRDLHEEQKRNESRRSSILAASIGSIPEADEHIPLSHQISGIGSILETNITARQGGYSPAAFVLSASTSRSNSTRLRSGSNPLSRPDLDAENLPSRHGPGKSSVRSVRSIKPTLTHIDEMEPPTTLTAAAMDAADKLPEVPDEDETLRIPSVDDHGVTPNGHQYQDANAFDYWDQAVADAQREAEYKRNKPPSPAGSAGTHEQTDMTFADFDGAHCSPDADFEEIPFGALDSQATRNGPWPSRPAVPRPLAGNTERPKSYLDPETGNAMLYYPARVPMMLNLPAKLSKKPKNEVRNVRRSQILNAMPEANRQSGAAWLPEFQPEPLEPFGPQSEPAPSQSHPEQGPEPPVLGPQHEQSEMQPLPQSNITDVAEKRKSRMSLFDTNKRKSQNPNIDGLPPQLRASAFFELPSEPSPTIELKDGSAMATLDSILDASAKAPVSAFTDHAFAGSLGAEVYGVGNKKRRSHLKKASNATTNILEPKKRSSFLHLRKQSGMSRQSGSKEDRQETHEKNGAIKNVDEGDEEGQPLSGSIDGEHDEEQDEGEGGEETVYNGPPTTLLAELQMRKQHQKLRTRPLTQTYPNGLHSTLLELDTVAEIERRTRNNKKVNLAWEGASAGDVEDSEDEDTPLGLLMARKGQGHDNDAVVLAELHRPPGLMEQKDMEENEPLSRRRDRLQGRENGPIQRQSMMSLGQGLGQVMNRNNGLRAPSPRLQVHAPDEDENESETLGERMRRLRAREEGENPANSLPRARPVSSSFSAELLGQLGDAFKNDDDDESKGKGKGKGKENPPPPPEEETLGQRRRRLQAEREAAATAAGGGAPQPQPPKLTQRHSMADVLGAVAAAGSKNPRRTMLSDPRTDRDRARQEEAARYRADQEHKLAAFRGQMPATATTGINAMGQQQQQSRASMYGAIPGMGTGVRMSMRGGGGVGNAYPAAVGYGAPMSMPMNMPMAAGAGAMAAVPPYAMTAVPGQIQPPAPMDRVESWRQSIWP